MLHEDIQCTEGLENSLGTDVAGTTLLARLGNERLAQLTSSSRRRSMSAHAKKAIISATHVMRG